MHPARGFRFSTTDGAVLLAGALITVIAWNWIGDYAALVAVTLLHFLLFCNVFRIRRKAELWWAATFVVNVIAWELTGAFTWWRVLAVQLPITTAVLAYEIRRPEYHGVGSHRPRDG